VRRFVVASTLVVSGFTSAFAEATAKYGMYVLTLMVALASATGPSFAQKAKDIGKCMRADCGSMQKFCEESRSAGKTGTNCEAAGKLCLESKGRWVGTTPDGKKWTCTFT
jgi:hypothetical protein